MKQIDKLIINSPYVEPTEHWFYDRETREFDRKSGRRDAGYIKATEGGRGFDDAGIFVPIELANQIRPRVRQWRENGYPGVTGITKRLLQHSNDPEERQDRRFFFCQLEAIETLIWLIEAPDAEKTGIEIPGEGGAFERLCSKMATGSGKTIVFKIASSIYNSEQRPERRRILIMLNMNKVIQHSREHPRLRVGPANGFWPALAGVAGNRSRRVASGSGRSPFRRRALGQAFPGRRACVHSSASIRAYPWLKILR